MGLLTAAFGEDARVLDESDLRLLLLANTVYPLGAGLVSPLLDALVDPMGTTPEGIGLLMTAFFGPSIVVTPVVGRLADRYGRRPILVSGLVLFGVGGAGMALSTDFGVVLALRLVQGVGAAGVLPVVVTGIGDLFEGGAETTAQGVRHAVHSLAATAAPLIAGGLIVFGWRYPIAVYGVSLPIAAVVALRFEEPVETGDGGPETSLGDLLALSTRPGVLPVLVAMTFPTFLFVGFLTYNSFVVVRGLGGTAGTAGLLVAVATAASGTAASQTGRIAAFFDRRRDPLLAANAAQGIGLAAVGLAWSFPVAVVGAALLGGGFGVALSSYRSALTGLAPERLRGGLVSLGETARGVGTALPPVVLGAAIAATAPSLGTVGAVRAASAGAGVVGGIVGVGLVLAATRSSDLTDPS